MTGGPELKKVRPGDKLTIPAGDWNAAMDAARAHRQDGALIQKSRRTTGSPPGVVNAYNASAEKAPMHAMVEVCEAGETAAQIEFCRPGERADARRRYGVTIESIPPGSIGRIALSGGPWRVWCPYADATARDTLGPLPGYWYATTGGELLDVVRGKAVTEDEEIVLAFFRKASGNNALYAPENERVVQEHGPPEGWGYFPVDFKQTYDGALWTMHTDVFRVGKFTSPVPFPENARGLVMLQHHGFVAASYRSYENAQTGADLYASLYLKVIAEDFDLSTVDRAALAGLKGQERFIRWRVYGGPWDTGHWYCHSTGEIGSIGNLAQEMYGHDEDWQIYGLACYGAPDGFDFGAHADPRAGDMRVVQGNIYDGGMVFGVFTEQVSSR